MESYELTLVLPEKTTPAKKKSTQELVEKLIKTLKGKITKVDEWGELKLSYKIKGSESGIFLHYWLELEKQAVKEIDTKLRLEEDIIRYLLVKKEVDKKGKGK
jgi:small subunit ribosomal protein S6